MSDGIICYSDDRPKVCLLKIGLTCYYSDKLAIQSSCKGCRYAPPEIVSIMPGQGSRRDAPLLTVEDRKVVTA